MQLYIFVQITDKFSANHFLLRVYDQRMFLFCYVLFIVFVNLKKVIFEYFNICFATGCEQRIVKFIRLNLYKLNIDIIIYKSNL